VGEPFAIAFARPHPFGVLAGVHLPGGKCPVPPGTLDRLDPREGEVARSLAGYRQPEWVGARLAARAAAEPLQPQRWAVLSYPDGAPRPPTGCAVSLAHKRGLAVALVAPEADGALGIDVEDDFEAASAAAEEFLDPAELESVRRLPLEEQRRGCALAFALKEAAYKALARRVGRALRYDEARVDIHGPMLATVTMRLDGAAPQPLLQAECEAWRGYVIAAVRWAGASAHAQ
jgi:4'-phosphopantetheinyl transferase EntD